MRTPQGKELESLETLIRLLRHRGRWDLGNLLSRSGMEFLPIGDGFSYNGDNLVTLVRAMIVAPISDYDRLLTLSSEDDGIILGSLQEIWPYDEQEGDILITEIGYRLAPDSIMGEALDVDSLLQLLSYLRHVMIDVSTGGRAIKEVNQSFRESFSELTSILAAKGLSNPIPYSDLWDWYGKWSSGELPTYRSRREYIRGIFEPIEQQVREGLLSPDISVFSEPTGWPLVDRQLGEVRSRLQGATTEEQFQAVGVLCRETLISLAQIVFDPKLHPPIDETVDVSSTDAKRMLDRYLAVEIAGESNAIARKLAKGSLDFANALQHRRTAGFRDAALCAESTASVVNYIAIISGARDH